MEYLENCGEDFAALAMPDHPTPLAIMTHTADPVPFALYFSDGRMGSTETEGYTEANALGTGVYVSKACSLMDMMTK